MGSNRILLFLLLSSICWSQDSLTLHKATVDFSGYIDGYYAHDFNNSDQLTKQSFFYNHNRHNEFNINIALFRAIVNYKNTYAKVSFQAGTYVDDNYSNETIKYLNEALIGAYLDPLKNIALKWESFLVI